MKNVIYTQLSFLLSRNIIFNDTIFPSLMEEANTNRLDILFLSNNVIHKSSVGLCFWALDPLIERFYQNPSLKGSEAQKQRPTKLL